MDQRQDLKLLKSERSSIRFNLFTQRRRWYFCRKLLISMLRENKDAHKVQMHIKIDQSVRNCSFQMLQFPFLHFFHHFILDTVCIYVYICTSFYSSTYLHFYFSSCYIDLFKLKFIGFFFKVFLKSHLYLCQC